MSATSLWSMSLFGFLIVRYAEENDIDVVLIDTAGRMQNNERLMRSLVKLVNQNNPNFILFVGEALVGNDGVDQLVEFNRVFYIDIRMIVRLYVIWVISIILVLWMAFCLPSSIPLMIRSVLPCLWCIRPIVQLSMLVLARSIRILRSWMFLMSWILSFHELFPLVESFHIESLFMLRIVLFLNLICYQIIQPVRNRCRIKWIWYITQKVEKWIQFTKIVVLKQIKLES